MQQESYVDDDYPEEDDFLDRADYAYYHSDMERYEYNVNLLNQNS